MRYSEIFLDFTVLLEICRNTGYGPGNEIVAIHAQFLPRLPVCRAHLVRSASSKPISRFRYCSVVQRVTSHSFSLLMSSGRKSILREAIRRTSDGVNRHAIASAPQ
ncbi:hypothetical protein ALC53_09518 [Atta colombica]|uniref:Uncharacterized protein n=1 Tax=Atta colombica TaxID=520822 RepID=A0A195B6V2_9HYME|nr:hypothetical protein ALC53_09518 [Atta colombica]